MGWLKTGRSKGWDILIQYDRRRRIVFTGVRRRRRRRRGPTPYEVRTRTRTRIHRGRTVVAVLDRRTTILFFQLFRKSEENGGELSTIHGHKSACTYRIASESFLYVPCSSPLSCPILTLIPRNSPSSSFSFTSSHFLLFSLTLNWVMDVTYSTSSFLIHLHLHKTRLKKFSSLSSSVVCIFLLVKMHHVRSTRMYYNRGAKLQ